MVKIVKNIHIEDGKVSGNAKVSDLDKYTNVKINGQEITSDGVYQYVPNTVISSTDTQDGIVDNTATVVANEPAVGSEQNNIVKTKRVVHEEKKNKRSFWQRHEWLRILLIILLCLLLIGLLMIAAYHVMHAINNSNKNDKIDDAKKADEEVKKNKDKISEENQKKLEEGKLTKEDVEKEATRQTGDKKLAEDTKDYIDKYNKETDSTKKTDISNQYANSQEEALKSGQLNSTSLNETLKREQGELDIAKQATDEATTAAKKAGISDADINAIKADSGATVAGDYKASNQTSAIETLRNSVKNQVQEQADVDYVNNKLADVQAYENATTDAARTDALKNFTTNENNRFTNNPAISSADVDKWTSWENSELQGVGNFAKSFDTMSDIAQESGFTYKPGITTTNEMTQAIKNHYDNKFPKSDGAFRIVADSLAAAGLGGAVITGLAGLVGNAVTKDGDATAIREEQIVDNGKAEQNTKTVTKTTTTVKR